MAIDSKKEALKSETVVCKLSKLYHKIFNVKNTISTEYRFAPVTNPVNTLLGGFNRS